MQKYIFFLECVHCYPFTEKSSRTKFLPGTWNSMILWFFQVNSSIKLSQISDKEISHVVFLSCSAFRFYNRWHFVCPISILLLNWQNKA